MCSFRGVWALVFLVFLGLSRRMCSCHGLGFLSVAYRSMSSFMSSYICMYMYTFLPMHVHVHIHIDNKTNSTIPTHWTDALSKKDKNQRKQ